MTLPGILRFASNPLFARIALTGHFPIIEFQSISDTHTKLDILPSLKEGEDVNNSNKTGSHSQSKSWDNEKVLGSKDFNIALDYNSM